METSKEQIMTVLRRTTGTPLTTSAIAAQINLSRSVTSHYLNELQAAHQIFKIEGRPVQWSLIAPDATATPRNQAFADFIGAQGSLTGLIEQCEAAVKYPPRGLNVLITGNSGVGKSYLAAKIVDYARDEGVVAADAPFAVLNCADYANNPELLSSILFGYVKGAYTGADEPRSGILQQADGGFLFLDEIHRLSSENQEKLFSFIDRGVYYKMGDNDHPQHAAVRLILATTADPERVLLDTFRRRIPITIKLPDFARRPVDERLQIVETLLRNEARQLDRQLFVPGYLLHALVRVQAAGNIGYLKNLMKRGCARAYKDQSDQQVLTLTPAHFDITGIDATNTYADVTIDVNAPRLLNADASTTIDQQRLAALLAALVKNNGADADAYTRLDDQLQSMAVNVCSETLNHPLALKFRQRGEHVIRERFGIPAPRHLGLVLFDLYLQRFRLSADETSVLERTTQSICPRALHVARVFFSGIVELNGPSTATLTALLALAIHDLVDEKIPRSAILIAHGVNTATSIQAVVNQLCGTYVVDAIDMPINTGVSAVVAQTQELVDRLGTSNGLILMVDMGSLEQLYSELRSHLDGDLLVVNNLTTVTALDIGLKLQQRMPFAEIAEAAEHYTISAQSYTGFSRTPNILISCISGLGISDKLRDIIQPYLPLNIKCITVDYAQLKQRIGEQNDYFAQTLFVLTTNDLPAIKVPTLNIYDLLDAAGTRQLAEWLAPYVDVARMQQLNSELLRFFSIEGVSERLSFLNPDIVIKEVESVISKYEAFYHISLDGKVKLNLYMHIALMIERLLVRHQVNVPVAPPDAAEQEFIQVSNGIFRPIGLKYNITIDDYELSLLYELFKQFV